MTETLEYELLDVASQRGSDATEYAALTPGQVAKVMFDFCTEDGEPVGSESMWVEVTEVGDDGYTGVLRNDSVYAEMSNGEPIEFETRHVIGVHEPS